jgi:hypothetical protein
MGKHLLSFSPAPIKRWVILVLLLILCTPLKSLAYPHHSQINRTPYATGQGTINLAFEYRVSNQTPQFYLGKGISPRLDLGLRWDSTGKWGAVSKICLLTEDRYYLSLSVGLDTYDEKFYLLGGKILGGLAEFNLELSYDYCQGTRTVYLYSALIPSARWEMVLKLGFQDRDFSSSVIINFYPHRRWLIGIEQNLQQPVMVVRGSVLLN